MSLYDPCLWVYHQLLVFDPTVLRTPPFFRLILTISFSQKKRTRDRAVSFHGQIKRAKWNVFAPDSQDAMELWALRPHMNWVKVICVCELHVFFHQYVVDLRDERSENVVLLMSALRDSKPEVENYVCQSAGRTGKPENIFRTVSTSPLVFDMTVLCRSGVIRLSLDVPFGQLQPLTTVVSCTDAGSLVTPFVVPPPPDIEQPCRQLQHFLTCRSQASLLCGAVYRFFLPRARCHGHCTNFRRLRLRLTVTSLSAESRGVRRATPCCRRRRMTICVQV